MPTSPTGSRSLALALVGLLAASWLLLVSPNARAGTAVVFSEDFESGTFGPQWFASDNNAASGLDHWGVSDYRPYTGNYSAWSAQIGTQAVGGANNSAVHRYDNDMQADLVINLSVNGFTSLTLSFRYYSRAESGGGDFIQAWYEAGGVQTIIFTNTGFANWDFASTPVPNNVERLIIRFQTDGSNNNFEGAYVDEVVLTGTENVPPSSAISALPTYTNAVPFFIPYTAQDNANASGVAYVELWWRQGTTGPFSLYTRPANPLGRWFVSPISFDASFARGDGYYEFYTVAMDNANNMEPPPAVADATLTMDTVPPSVSVTAPQGGAWANTASVTVTWQGSDALSGLDRYEVAVDGLTPTVEGLAVSKTIGALGEGAHGVDVTAYDRAGNAFTANVSFGVDTVLPSIVINTPASGARFHVDDVTFRWEAQDLTSGIDHYEVWVDGGGRRTTDATELTIEGIRDGDHTFHVLAVDRAGNSAEARVTFRVVTGVWSWDGPYGPFPLLALIVVILVALLMLFLWWRKREEERPPAPAPPAESQESPEPAGDGQEPGDTPEPPDPG